MYETLEYYDNSGCDLKEVLKSCIYKYYLLNKCSNNNEKQVFEKEKKNSIIERTNKVNVLSRGRS